ncbi:hypothetical protein K9L67_03665 [Candidatus Woesearchaeota archaeon]|nr:hypothetical protein [Candidatus Woesearchaeota archaeon]MCF7901299.1 hypothetical protein [Candidatus Woesearchaeota archaeon]MCF8013795.1 hypothetical protein [Candidatus Woesearchaeota archaeon]
MNSKKAEGSLWYVVGIVLVLIFLYFQTNIFTKIFVSVDETISKECPGTCRETSCVGAELSTPDKCPREGQKKLSCCATIKQIADAKEKKESESNSQINSDGTSTNETYIEIRMGESTTKIENRAIYYLLENITYDFHFYGTGPKASTCTVKLLEQNGAKTKIKGLTKTLEKVSCKGEANKATLSLKPQNVVDDHILTMQVELFDEKDVRNQSSVITIKLKESKIESLPLDMCFYESCEETPIEACKASVTNCPDLKCEWNRQEQKCQEKTPIP